MMVSGGSSDLSVAALEKLLTVVTDPQAAQKRLTELVEQANATQQILDKVSQLNQANEDAKGELQKMKSELAKQVVEHEQAVQKTLNDFHARETDFKAKTAALDQRAVVFSDSMDKLKKAEIAHEAMVADFKVKMDKEHKDLHDAFISEMNVLHEQHNAKMAEVQKKADDLAAKTAAINEAKEAADRDKAFWEQKVGVLKQAIS